MREESEAAAHWCFWNKCSKKFRSINRKTPVLESLFKEVAGLQACNFIKNRIQHRCFPVNITKFLRTPFFKEHLRWLLLKSILHKIQRNAELYLVSILLWINWIFLYKKHFYKKLSLKNPHNLKKMLRKSPVSNDWDALFKNADFSWSSLKVTKLSKC